MGDKIDQKIQEWRDRKKRKLGPNESVNSIHPIHNTSNVLLSKIKSMHEDMMTQLELSNQRQQELASKFASSERNQQAHEEYSTLKLAFNELQIKYDDLKENIEVGGFGTDYEIEESFRHLHDDMMKNGHSEEYSANISKIQDDFQKLKQKQVLLVNEKYELQFANQIYIQQINEQTRKLEDCNYQISSQQAKAASEHNKLVNEIEVLKQTVCPSLESALENNKNLAKKLEEMTDLYNTERKKNNQENF